MARILTSSAGMPSSWVLVLGAGWWAGWDFGVNGWKWIGFGGVLVEKWRVGDEGWKELGKF